MSSAYLTRLPLAAGSVLAAQAGRAGSWVLARFMRAPGTNTAILALTTMTAMAASNALYSQNEPHPAPLFAAPAVSTEAPAEAPAPSKRTEPKLVQTTPVTRPASEPVRELATSPAPAKVGNAEMAEVQQKLKAMNLFSGTVDGYYGPKTAAAIRAFEERTGMKPVGAATPEVVAAILRASGDLGGLQLNAARPVADSVETAAVPAPLPVAIEVADTATAINLPAPEPLVAPRRTDLVVKTPVAPVAEKKVAAADPDLLDTLADKAANAFQAIADMVGPRQPMPAPLASGTSEIAYKPPGKVESPAAVSGPAETNRDLVTKVQRGLASLGFLAGKIDGVAGAATAKAIRNFEVYYSYDVTGRVTPELLRLLVDAGATI